MKKCLLLLLLSYTIYGTAQELRLKKGIIINAVAVNDSISESFALYLPTNFEVSKKWPVVFVFDLEGHGRQALGMFRTAAEEEGYILAASNNVRDTLSISKNVLISSRMMNSLYSILPILNSRIYTAGFSSGARFASLIPTFIRGVNGVISCGSPIANIEVLDSKRPFHFIGIVGNEDYNYTEMLNSQKALNKLRFPNHLMFFDGGHEWPTKEYLSKAMRIFTLSSMAKGNIPKDTTFIETTYQNYLDNVNAMVSENPLFAYKIMQEMNSVYRPLKNIDSLKVSARQLRKSKEYRSNNRNQNTVFFKEAFIKEDYVYYLEEDILTYNYNNLGWWKYQMDELAKYNKRANVYEKQMGKRLNAYINDLISDNIDVIKADTVLDEEALNLLWMLSTVMNPSEYAPYLKVISYNAKIEDYGTALFYVDELLKNGYTDKAKLYALENTALFRITPEFNKTVSKYLKDARYDIIEE